MSADMSYVPLLRGHYCHSIHQHIFCMCVLNCSLNLFLTFDYEMCDKMVSMKETVLGVYYTIVAARLYRMLSYSIPVGHIQRREVFLMDKLGFALLTSVGLNQQTNPTF